MLLALFGCFSLFSSADAGLYVIVDYYMSTAYSDSFGGKCGQTIQDGCLFLNSHVTNLRLLPYPRDNNCTVTLDAGKMRGARYKVKFLFLDLEENCENDYLAIYVGFEANDTSNLLSRYCGSSSFIDVQLATRRFVIVQFVTNGDVQHKGFKLMATRTEPPPCQKEEYLCKGEGLCIDGRLRCDGTTQCEKGEDEEDCPGFELFRGLFLALGSSGLVLLGFLLCFICCLLLLIPSVLSCCSKKHHIVPTHHHRRR